MKKIRGAVKTKRGVKPPVDAALVQGLSELVNSNAVVAGRSDVIPLSSVIPNPDNPRKKGMLSSEKIIALRDNKYDEEHLSPDETSFLEKLGELAQSIDDSDIGLIQPIVVYEQGGKFILHAGERRFLAHHYLGRDQIQAIIRPFTNNPNSDQGRLRDMSIALIENIQRDNLSFSELIQAIITLNKHFKAINKIDMKPKDLIKVIHQSKGQCSKLITIITGKKDVLTRISKGSITSQKEAYDLNRTLPSSGKKDLTPNSSSHPTPTFTESDGPQSSSGIQMPSDVSSKRTYVSLGNTKNQKMIKKLATLLLDKERLIGIDWNDYDSLQLIWDETLSHCERTM